MLSVERLGRPCSGNDHACNSRADIVRIGHLSVVYLEKETRIVSRNEREDHQFACLFAFKILVPIHHFSVQLSASQYFKFPHSDLAIFVSLARN
jgi:hypothetical protein